MLTRKLRPEEYWRAGLNMAIAFESPFEYEKELEKSQTAEYDPHEELYGTFLKEDDAPIASIIINRKQVRFDGHIVGMGGVGGVATLPAGRRGGAIRACMELSLRDLYEEGCALSHLYPFSTRYYRQYGFAGAGQSVRWTVKLQDLRGLPEAGGTVRQLFPGDDLGVLLDIYNQAYGDVNFSCLRETFQKNLEGDKPLRDKRWIFVWYDNAGTPGGLLVGTRHKDTLHCTPDFASNDAFVCTSPQALIGLLNFVRTAYIANFDAIEFLAPPSWDMTALLPELSGMDCKPVLNGMARAVNVETLLKLCRCRGEGRITLGISDGIIPQNNGHFLLDFAPGRENIVELTDEPAQVELDAGNLAALLGGARNAASIEMTPGIIVNDTGMDLGQIFYPKRCHVLDLF